MPMFRMLVVALLSLWSFASTAAPKHKLDGRDREVVFVNFETGVIIVALYAVNTRTEGWGENMIVGRQVLPQQVAFIEFEDGSGDCVFNLKAVTSDGKEYIRRRVDICRDQFWMATEHD